MNTEVQKLSVFPQEFFGFRFPEKAIIPLYNEVMEKKNEIKKISEMHDYPSADYWTDYDYPVKLYEFEKLIPENVSEYFKDLKCTCVIYWTAIYGKYGMHPPHVHAEYLFGKKVKNFSCVLYLTNVGSTIFYNPNIHSATEHNFQIKSQLGKMIMFPVNILHTSNPHNLDKEKIIISANWQIVKPDE